MQLLVQLGFGAIIGSSVKGSSPSTQRGRWMGDPHPLGLLGLLLLLGLLGLLLA